MIASPANRVCMRKNARICGRLLGVTLAGTLNAQAIPEVVVTCSALSDDERASVEARVHADLAVKGLEAGVVDVSCDAETARVRFHAGAVERASAAPLPDRGRARVEALLALVDAVTTSGDATATGDAVTTPSDAVTTAGDALQPAPAETEVAAVPAPAPPVPPPRPSPLPSRSSPLVHDAASPAPLWHVGAGIEGELWATEVSGAIGVRLRAGRRMGGPFGLGLVLAGDRASSAPDAVSVRVGRAGLEGAVCSDQAPCLVLGAQWTLLSAEGPSDWAPASHAKTTLAGTLRLDYAVELGAFQLVPGAGVIVYPARRTVTLNGDRVLSVPRLTGSAVLELRRRF